MSYRINAWIEEGKPRLQVLDSTSGSVRLAWKPGAAMPNVENTELKDLFQDLMLLSAAENIVSPSF